MLTDKTSEQEVIIACDPGAIPANMREQWAETGKQIYVAVQEVRELADGYGFRLPTNSAMLLKVAAYINNERLCCAFLHFTVEVEPNKGPIWLHLTGGAGVKEYIRSLFEKDNLLNASVARDTSLQEP
jgi:hypothetical protein